GERFYVWVGKFGLEVVGDSGVRVEEAAILRSRPDIVAGSEERCDRRFGVLRAEEFEGLAVIDQQAVAAGSGEEFSGAERGQGGDVAEVRGCGEKLAEALGCGVVEQNTRTGCGDEQLWLRLAAEPGDDHAVQRCGRKIEAYMEAAFECSSRVVNIERAGAGDEDVAVECGGRSEGCGRGDRLEAGVWWQRERAEGEGKMVGIGDGTGGFGKRLVDVEDEYRG